MIPFDVIRKLVYIYNFENYPMMNISIGDGSPNVLGRKNWLFSVSEAGAKANAICLSIAETAKSNGVDFYEYTKKFLMDLPNLDIHQTLRLVHALVENNSGRMYK
jgi:hypothetical protein